MKGEPMKRLAVVLGVMALTLAIVPPAAAATEMTVTIYENTNGGGDHMSRTNFYNQLYNATLVGDIAGLSGTPLCNTQYWPFAGSDWNDCASSVWVGGLPAGWKVVFYFNPNYGGGATLCRSVNGSANFPSGTNDETSSWRVIPGSC
jgi:hypothetical protein